MTTQAASQKGSLFGALRALTDEITTEKTAAVRGKQAESPTPDDPGGYQGSSTHPTTSIDNRGQSASEGARSSENTADVNADQGEPGVNKAPDAKPGQQDEVQLNIGTQQSATGEDPSTEDDYKAGKDDPGSSHPAKTDNSALDGHKYANASVGQLKGLHDSLCNGILADLANGHGTTLTKEALAKAAGAPATNPNEGNLQPSAAGENTPSQPKAQMAGEAPSGEKQAGAAGGLADAIEKAAAAIQAGTPAAGNADLQAGYDLAAFLGIEKQGAQAVVAETLEATLQDAQLDADLFGSYMLAFQKRAAEGPTPEEGEDHSGGGDDTSGASEAKGAGGETAGGGGGGGDPMGGGGEGGSLGDLLGGGGDPGGLMGGGEMGGAPGGEMGGQPSEEEALMELVAALDELGIPIEQLAQAGGGEMGGGEMGGGMGAPPMGGEMGGAPPMGGPDGGMPPMDGGAPAPPPMGEGMKLASAAHAFRRSGKYRFKEAADGTRQRVLREQMKGHLLELMGGGK